MRRQSKLSLLVRFAAVLLAVAIVSSGCMRSPEEKYAQFMESGKQYAEQKDYDSAVLQFRNAARAMPNDAEALYQLALAELGRGEPQEAATAALKAERLDPEHRGVKMLLAEMMILHPDLEVVQQGEERLEQLRLQAEGDSDVLFLLAATKRKLGSDDQDVQNLLEEALKNSPKHLQSRVALARQKLEQGQPDAAVELMKQAVAAEPEAAAPKLSLGQLYLVLNRSKEAEAQFQEVLDKDPNSVQALLGLAVVRLRADQKDQAEEIFKQIALLPEKSTKTLYGRILVQHDKLEQAIGEFQRLAKEDPQDQTVRSLLTGSYLRANRLPDAERYLQGLLEQNADDRDARTRLVAVYVASKQDEKARELLAQALEKNPKDADSLLQRAELHLKNGRIDEAMEDLGKVLENRPTSHQAHYLLAQVYQARNDTRLQRQELAKAVELRPDFLIARIALSDALRASGNPQAALDLLDQAPENNKQALAFLVARNWALIQTGDEAAARAAIDRALASSTAPALLLQDGLLKLTDRDYAGARTSLQAALDQEPENLQALGALAQTYVAQNQAARATETIRKHVAARPNSAPLQYFLGSWYLQTGYRGEARQAFAAAKAADPSFVDAQIRLAQMDMAEGKLDEARQGLLGVLAGNPRNGAAHLYLALLEDSAKNYDAAIDYYRKCLDLQPGNVVALNNLAYRLAVTRNQVDEGLRYAQQAKEVAPDNPSVDDTLGWLYYLKGVYQTAVRHLESAASSDSGKGNAVIHYHLAMAHIKQGDVEEGRRVLAIAEKLNANAPEAAEAKRLLEEARAQ